MGLGEMGQNRFDRRQDAQPAVQQCQRTEGTKQKKKIYFLQFCVVYY